MLRVGVFGAAGRMGTTVSAAVAGAPDLELVAAVDPVGVGRPALEGRTGTGAGGSSNLLISGDASAMLDAGVEVAVDFTRAESAMENLRFCAASGTHAVSGTSGISPADVEELARVFDPDPTKRPAGASNCAWVPNFAIGAVLMMRFAEIAARFFDAVEVIELHHDGKLDAPSGTAAATAERMTSARIAAGREAWPEDATRDLNLASVRGGEGAGGVRIHSVRLPGLVAHQEVVFGTTGQTLSIRHDSYDRASFMPGVLLAVRSTPFLPGLTVGLDALLDL